jgi:hypothetical protein
LPFEQLERFLSTITGTRGGLMSAPSSATLRCGSLLAALLASLGVPFGQGRAALKRLCGSTQHRDTIPRGRPRLAHRAFGLL